QPLGDSTDDAAGPHRGVGEFGLDLVAYGPFPALAGHAGAFGPSVREHLGQPEVVAVDVGVGQGLQRVDVQVRGGVHAVSLSEWSAVAVWACLLRWRRIWSRVRWYCCTHRLATSPRSSSQSDRSRRSQPQSTGTALARRWAMSLGNSRWRRSVR